MVTEVPEALKRLTRYIVRGFYSLEHSIIIDFLVRNPCMKEDDLLELLKFERKQLRANLETLKQDQFLKVRMRVETDEEGKTTRHNYYFINYKVFVNVVKYKLDHMRRKIETEERDSTSRASFLCPTCEKQFTDLEADQLYDFTTQMFICTYCGSEVSEQTQALPKKDAITILARFNEQIEPIYALLREVEDVKLAPEILEPEPTNVKNLLKPKAERGPRDHAVWSGDAKRDVGFGATEGTVSVEFNGASATAKQQEVKERPIWLVESTVKGASADAVAAAESRLPQAAKESRYAKKSDDDIMRTLLVHESKSSAAPLVPSNAVADDQDSDPSDDEKPTMTSSRVDASDVIMESDDDDEDVVPLVAIGDEQIPYGDVTEDMVARMTPAEKDEYIKIGQEMYASLYDD